MPWLSKMNGDDDPLLVQLDLRRLSDQEMRNHFAPSLSENEIHRLKMYKCDDDRDRFLFGHAVLRNILGLWLGVPASQVPISNGMYGKPFLEAKFKEIAERSRSPHTPQFNISHSGNLVLLAISRDRPIGIDVEQNKSDFDWSLFAKWQAHLSEQRNGELPDHHGQKVNNFQAWCRLEARYKAHGIGLIGLETGEEHNIPIGSEHVWDIKVPEGYSAAVAVL